MENNINLIQIKNLLNDNGVILSFTGFLSQGLIQEMGEVLKKGLRAEDFMTSTNYGVFAIFVEITQNIINYVKNKSENADSEFAKSGIVSIGKTGDKYFVYSANMIENGDIDPLKERLERINSLSFDEIKKTYKEQMRNKRDDETNNAGLGLLEMAKKSGSRLEYDFVPKDDKYSYFNLNIII